MISEYPKMATYMPPALKSQLKAASLIQGIPAWKIINLALEQYLGAMPKADRAALDAVTERLAAKGKP